MDSDGEDCPMASSILEVGLRPILAPWDKSGQCLWAFTDINCCGCC